MPDHPAARFTRRDFLNLSSRLILAASGLFGLGMLLRYLGFQDGAAPPDSFDLGPVENFPPGSQTVLTQTAAVVVHANSGFMAYSLVCPHLGCTIQPVDDGFACPCHGSQFAEDGALRKGPAARPMRRLRIDQNSSGHLIRYSDQSLN